MDFPDNRNQICNKFPPADDQPLSIADQLPIPDIQSFSQFRMIKYSLEKTVALIERFVVIAQIRQIDPVDLRQLRVDKMPALRRTVFYDVQVLR